MKNLRDKFYSVTNELMECDTLGIILRAMKNQIHEKRDLHPEDASSNPARDNEFFVVLCSGQN